MRTVILNVAGAIASLITVARAQSALLNVVEGAAREVARKRRKARLSVAVFIFVDAHKKRFHRLLLRGDNLFDV
jgi:hypothetical protein